MQFVTYDPCITDYSDTIVSIHAGHDIIIIVNPVEVVVQGVDAKILQIVVNKQQIIDQSLIMINNEELTLINLVGNYFNKSLQNQYQGSHVLVVSNIDQVSLDNQVLICESNNVKSIDITRGSRLETLLIDGITVLRNKYYLIDDFKVFQQYPIRPISLQLTDTQLDKVPDNFLQYCEQIICKDSGQNNSMRLINSRVQHLTMHDINQLYIYPTMQKLHYGKASSTTIMFNQGFEFINKRWMNNYFDFHPLYLNVWFNRVYKNIQRIYQLSIEKFSTSFNHNIFLNLTTIHNFQLNVAPQNVDSQGYQLQHLNLYKSTIHTLCLPQKVSIAEIVIIDSCIQEVIAVDNQLHNKVSLSFYQELNQLQNLKKITLSDLQIPEIILGDHTISLIHLRFLRVKIGDLQIKCPIEKYECMLSSIQSFYYCCPMEIRKLTLQANCLLNQSAHDQYWVNYINSNMLEELKVRNLQIGDFVVYANLQKLEISECTVKTIEVKESLNLRYLKLFKIQHLGPIDILCHTPKIEKIFISNLNNLLVPDSIYKKKAFIIRKVESIQIVNDQMLQIGQVHYSQNIEQFSLVPSISRLECYSTRILSYDGENISVQQIKSDSSSMNFSKFAGLQNLRAISQDQVYVSNTLSELTLVQCDKLRLQFPWDIENCTFQLQKLVIQSVRFENISMSQDFYQFLKSLKQLKTMQIVSCYHELVLHIPNTVKILILNGILVDVITAESSLALESVTLDNVRISSQYELALSKICSIRSVRELCLRELQLKYLIVRKNMNYQLKCKIQQLYVQHNRRVYITSANPSKLIKFVDTTNLQVVHIPAILQDTIMIYKLKHQIFESLSLTSELIEK